MKLDLSKSKSDFTHELIACVYRIRFDSASEIASIAEETWVKAQLEVEDGLHKALYDGESLIIIICFVYKS